MRLHLEASPETVNEIFTYVVNHCEAQRKGDHGQYAFMRNMLLQRVDGGVHMISAVFTAHSSFWQYLPKYLRGSVLVPASEPVMK